MRNRDMKARHQLRRRFSLQPSFLKEDADDDEERALETDRCERRHRVVVMGAAKVGKSSLISRFLYGSFSARYKRTVEEMHHGDFTGLKLDILDTSGAYEFPAMRALSISSGDAFILVYDVTDAASFAELRGLRDQILETKGGVAAPIVVVGNKLDLVGDGGGAAREVDLETTESVVTVDWENGFVEASAKEDVNVTRVFKELLAQAKVSYNLSPALRRRRRQSLARHSISGEAAAPSPQQLHHLQQHAKRNSCLIS